MEILQNVTDDRLKVEIEKLLATNNELKSQNASLTQRISALDPETSQPAKSSFFNLSKLSSSQTNSTLEAIKRENVSLKEKILNIETQFQLQNKTLSDECLRLTKELAQSQKKFASSSLKSISVQTESTLVSVESQTDPSDQYLDHLSLDELEPTSPIDKIKELENENLRLKKSFERTKRDYQRQLALMKKKLTGYSTNVSSTNLYSPTGSQLLQSPTENVSLYNITNGNNADNVSEHGSVCSYSQSSYTDFDFKVLLDKLTTCQDEIGQLKRKVQEQQSELYAKSIIIQNKIFPGQIGKPENVPASSSVIKGKGANNKVNAKKLMADFSALKNLCEELMMKNVTLTESLERAVSSFEVKR